MLLVRVGSIWIGFFLSILGHMKPWLSSKVLVPKFFDSSCKQYIILEYPNILVQEIIHEVLM